MDAPGQTVEIKSCIIQSLSLPSSTSVKIPRPLFTNFMGNQSSSRIPSPTRSSCDEKDGFTAVSYPLSISIPLSNDGSLTLAHVAGWEAAANADSKVKLARTILFQSDMRSALKSRSAKIAVQHVFNHSLDFKTGPVTDQKSSGRCWLFATTNVLRYHIMKRFKLKDFQFSQVSLCSCQRVCSWPILCSLASPIYSFGTSSTSPTTILSS